MHRFSLVLTVACVWFSSVQAGPLIYMCDDTGKLWTVDTSNGTATILSSMHDSSDNPVVMTDIALDPTTNVLYGISSDDRLYTIAPSTGLASPVGQLGFVTGGLFRVVDANALEFDAAGNLYAAGDDTMQLLPSI
ncbi:MAG: hypothetical protein C4297_12170 [Gemmataceae bacterium]